MALPKFEIYTRDKTSPRSFPWQWILRLTGIVLTIIVLGITAQNHSTFSNSGCSSPSKLNYNLAVSILSFLALIYFILSTGPSPKVRLLPWFIWGQLALDALLFILWLAAAASSRYNCTDLCNACNFEDLYYDNLYCYCNVVLYKRDTSPVPRGPLEKRRFHGGSSSGSNSGSAGARQAFDAIVTVNFFLCLAADLYWIFLASKSHSTTPGQAQTTPAPIKYEESGMAPPAAGMPMNNQNPQYYNGQPMQQQEGYQQQQQGQYPPQYAQGQQQYSQPQNLQQQPYPQNPGMAQDQRGYVEPKQGSAEVYSPGHQEAGHPPPTS